MMLVDAGPLVALLHRDDQHHRRCLAALKRIREPLFTVWPAVTEAMYLLGFSPAAQHQLWERLLAEEPAIAPLGTSDLPRLRELMARYADRGMDLADAALVRVAERDGIERIFTVDRTDFTVYRIDGRRRFTIVP